MKENKSLQCIVGVLLCVCDVTIWYETKESAQWTTGWIKLLNNGVRENVGKVRLHKYYSGFQGSS